MRYKYVDYESLLNALSSNERMRELKAVVRNAFYNIEQQLVWT